MSQTFTAIYNNIQSARRLGDQVLLDLAKTQYDGCKDQLSDEQIQVIDELLSQPFVESKKVHIPVEEIKECKLDDPSCENCSS